MKTIISFIISLAVICGMATAQTVNVTVNPSIVLQGQPAIIDWASTNLLPNSITVEDLTTFTTIASGQSASGTYYYTDTTLGVHIINVFGDNVGGGQTNDSRTFTVVSSIPVLPAIEPIPFSVSSNCLWLSPCVDKEYLSTTKFGFKFNDTCSNVTFDLNQVGSSQAVTDMVNNGMFQNSYMIYGKQFGTPFALSPVYFSGPFPTNLPNLGTFLADDSLFILTSTTGFSNTAQQSAWMWPSVVSGDYMQLHLNLHCEYDNAQIFQSGDQFGTEVKFFDWTYDFGVDLVSPYAPVIGAYGQEIEFQVSAQSHNTDGALLTPVGAYLENVTTSNTYPVAIDANHGQLWFPSDQFLGCGLNNYLNNYKVYLDSTDIPSGNYTLCVVVTNGIQELYSVCSNAFDYTVSTIDVEEAVNSNFIVSPNPVPSDIANISFVSEHFGVYSITDMAGRLILQGSVQKGDNSIDIQTLSTGMYLISIQGADSCGGCKILPTTTRFVK